MRLQPNKCEFLRKEVAYLGHIIGENGVKPDSQKLHAVENFPKPSDPKGIKQFLGLAGYYRRFIPDFSKIARPLTNLLKGDTNFEWSDAQEQAFASLKTSLCTEPLLQYPDFTRSFIVATDASKYAIGGILSQGIIGKDRPIAYTSRLLNSAEQNYSTIEKELLAIIYSVNHFRPYLYGRKFELVTDHKPLTWLNSVKDPTSRLMRWKLKLAEYEYDITYRAGKTNLNADALSRNPTTFSTAEDNKKPDCHKTLLPLTTKKKAISSLANDQTTIHSSVRDEIFDISDTELDDSSDDSDAQIPDAPNAPHQRFNIRTLPDDFTTRKDNLVIFVTQRGEPCDQEARMLKEQNRLPRIENATLGRARLIDDRNRYIIALIVKERISEVVDNQMIVEVISSLLDVVNELALRSVSICQSDLDRVPWYRIEDTLNATFHDHSVKISICNNQVTVPPIGDRPRILNEYHDSAVGGHKGVTKTYLRIKERYRWPNMKTDIQNYIQNCRNCQQKKLVRAKTRQPMVLTDTPGTAFEKISMDIMGPLPETRTGNSYILTIQDLLTKYSLALPLKQTTAIDVAAAFVNDFVCVYGAPRAIRLKFFKRTYARSSTQISYHTI